MVLVKIIATVLRWRNEKERASQYVFYSTLKQPLRYFRLSDERCKALLKKHEEMKERLTRLQERGDDFEDYANRLKQSTEEMAGRVRPLEASLVHAGRAMEEMQKEHERLLVPYNLMLTERTESAKRMLEIKHQLEASPEGRQVLQNINRMMREREAQRECSSLLDEICNLNFVQRIMLRDLLISVWDERVSNANTLVPDWKSNLD